MKVINKINFVGAIVFVMTLSLKTAAFNNITTLSSSDVGSPSKSIDPSIPPESVPEEVIMFIQFETEACNYTGDMGLCSVPGKIDRESDKKIILKRISYYACQDSGTDDQVGNGDCSEYYTKTGHWIDLYEASPLFKRYIGIVTVIKSNNEKNSWYQIKVEILSRGKTLAQMEAGFKSWNQLQSVKLLAEEINRDNRSIKTYLNIGPSIYSSASLNKNVLSDQNLEPIQWNVTKGKIIQ